MELGRSVPDQILQDAIRQAREPERARRYFAELSKRDEAAFARIVEDAETARRAAVVFSSSAFLSEELLRYPGWLLELGDVAYGFTTDEYSVRLAKFVRETDAAQLALFRRRELLRVLLRDQLHAGTLEQITEELSNLADAILGRALEATLRHLTTRFGRPAEEETAAPAEFCAIALGKLGGRELNYSSDIDLMFVYSANGETTGPQKITNKEFFHKAANELTSLLSSYTAVGQCYRLDLRLRPEGSHGEVCISLQSAREYYARRARDWELQMLLKARPAAGDARLANVLLKATEPRIYSTSVDFSTIETMSATRERIGEKFAARTRKAGGIDVKLTPGGIRDIEFLTQCMQRLHGSREEGVKNGGTLRALERLHEKDLLSTTEFSRLAHAYQFLRRVEHVLQVEHDRQTHTLPVKREELERVARHILEISEVLKEAGSDLLRELNQHLENVQAIYERIVHAQRPLYYSAAPVLHGGWDGRHKREMEGESETKLMERSESSASFAKFLSEQQLAGGRLSKGPEAVRWVKKILALSPWLAGQLAREPQLIEEVVRASDNPARRYAFEGLAAPLNDIAGLRKFFRYEMFRIQASSICVPEPVFQTLDQTSALAEFVIARAYRIALEKGLAHAREHATAERPFTEPQGEMMVVALGRLGMREFDIGSDADLLFILPETEASRHRFWTRVAERLLEIVSAYAEGGPILSIDTRLRPNGREGMLVQPESQYVEYFSTGAQAWEGIAYMKARAVAGDTERATKFLSELQQVDWRRYGQSGRSKLDLLQMRLRLEREQGTNAPLKAAQGSYYDADFILMYLRLRGAGMFFKSLNTPERIDILEKMGHLERADAEFLLQATTYFRALDHALRIVSGHSGGKIPVNEDERAMLAELIERWTGQEVMADDMEKSLAELQGNMRRLFERIFAQP